jgi:hypothetical protein
MSVLRLDEPEPRVPKRVRPVQGLEQRRVDLTRAVCSDSRLLTKTLDSVHVTANKPGTRCSAERTHLSRRRSFWTRDEFGRSLAGPQRCTGVGSGGAAGCADEVAGLPRRPGRVASGGEAEANVAWPPTRRARNLRSLRERAQGGPSAHDLPGAVSSPRCPRAARTPLKRSTLAPKDLRAERVGATPSLRRKRPHVGGQIRRLPIGGRDASPARPEGLRRPPRRKMPGLANHRTRAASRPQPASEGARAPSEQ